MDPATMYLISSLVSGGLGALGSAFGGNNSGQERVSFERTGADPVDWLSDVKASLSNVLQSAAQRASEPIDLSGSQPIAPQSVPTGYPPRRVGAGFAGVSSAPPSRVQFSGFDIPRVNDAPNVGIGANDRLDNYRGHTNDDPSKVVGTAVPRGSVPMRNSPNLGTVRSITDFPSAVAGQTSGIDPHARASAQLLLHSLLARPTQNAA